MRVLRPALFGVHRADVCVVGGGLAGCLAALELARRGRRVALLEAREIAWNVTDEAGHVAVGLGSHYADEVAALGRDGARNIWEVHRDSHAQVRELVATLGTACRYESRGGFALALDRDEGGILADSEDALRDDGFPGEFLDHYMLESRFEVRGFAGGYWSMDGGAIDARRFVTAVAAAAEAAGAAIFEGSPVRHLEHGGSGVRAETPRGCVEADVAVVAAGFGASSLVPFLAERVHPLRAQGLAIAAEGPLQVPSPAHAGRGRVCWSVQPGRLVVGGFDLLGADEEPRDEDGTTPRVQEELERFAREHFLEATGPVVARWSGLLGVPRDGFPFIGPIPGEPLIALAGLAGLAFSYAPSAARWIAEQMISGRDETPARFQAARTFAPEPWPPAAPRFGARGVPR